MVLTLDMRDQGGPHGEGAPGRSERAQAFRLAQRHTALVRALRIALPVGAGCLVLFYAVMLTASWRIGAGRLRVGQVEVTADDLIMKNPSYFGVTKDGGRYELRAKKAVLDFNRQAPIKLSDIDGDLVQVNDVVTKIKADRGLFDNAKNELELMDNIRIDGSNGLKARLSQATIYAKEHRVVSKHPVTVAMPTGTVRGSAMTMKNDTREATFVGDVKVHLAPSTPSGQTAAFGRDSRSPVDVTSEQLYVNDTTKVANFTGNVVAVQGDSTLRTPELYVTYEGKATDQLTGAAAQQGSDEGSRLSRMIAKKGSVVTAGTDRRVVSEQADFDAKADTALFTGNVTVNQLKNVLQGRRLFVDRKSGKSRLESPAEGGQPAGRITATFYQNESKAAAPQKPKAAAAEAGAAAQASVMGGFKTDPNAPIDVEADTLDVYDTAKQAVFRGNVKAQQGDFVVRTVTMTAFYSGQSAFGLNGAGADAASKTPSQLTRIEARQKVLITSKDGQTATGEWADFDVKANTVLLGGGVVVSRGKDVAEGPRLKIDLTTGLYRFELENEPAIAPAVPAIGPAAAPVVAPPPSPATAPAPSPTGRTCPPGKQCLLFYPKEAEDRAKKALPSAEPGKSKSGWQPSTSPSSVPRSD